MAIEVNFYDEVIYVTSPTTSVTILQLITALREAEDTVDGIAFGGEVKNVANGFADAEGKIDVGSGYYNPITITLHSDWYVEFWSGVGLGQVVGGNITGGLDSRPVRAASGSADTVLVLGAERGIEVADTSALWEEALSDHRDTGSFGEAIRRILWGSK
jgi:hypothetical protein